MKKLNQRILSTLALASLLGISSVFAQESTNTHTTITTRNWEPVVVTADRRQVQISDAKADISVVTRKEIETMHMKTIEEALRTVPGVTFLDYGANHMNQNLTGVRINGSKDIVVLVDGVRINAFQGPNSSGYMYANVLNDMDNIERIEVLRGAQGVLYGSEAKGGVINIITRTIKKQNTTLNLEGGSYGHQKFNLMTMGGNKKFEYKAYLNKTTNGDYKDGSGKTIKGESDSRSKGLEFAYNFNPDNKLSVSYTDSKANYSGEDTIYNNTFSGFYNTKSLTITSKVILNDQWDNTLTFRQSDINSKYQQNYGGYVYNAPADHYQYTFISEQLNHTTDRNYFVIGGEYTEGKLLSSFKSQPGNPNKEAINPNTWSKSFFVQDTFKVTPKLAISGGMRWTKPNMSLIKGTNKSKSFKISYDFNDKTSVYYGSSDFFILPSLYQLFANEYGNESLQPAQGNTRTIGISQQMNKGLLTWNWFQTKDIRNIGFRKDDGKFINTYNGIARGWNLQYLATFNKHLSGTFGWSHLFQEAKSDNYNLGYYPKNLLTLGLIYQKDKWTFGLDGFYFDRRESVKPVYKRVHGKKVPIQGWPHDKYAIFNFSANYKFNENTTAYFKINNVFNILWAEHTNVIWGGKPTDWYSMPGREYQFGINYKF